LVPSKKEKMKFNLVIVTTIAINRIVYAEESSSNGGLSEYFFYEESSLYYNANDDAIREDQLNSLNSELDRLSNLISDLEKEQDNAFENEIGDAPIQQLEKNDVIENSVDGDEFVNRLELSLGGKTGPIDDELNDLDTVLNNVVRSVEGLLNALLNPILGDKATGRPGLLTNLIDKLSTILNHADTLLDPQPRRPRRPRGPREDAYENDSSELDLGNVNIMLYVLFHL
jgi:hypothetical protein